MEDNSVETSLTTFCTQLLHHSQWKSSRTFTSGSSMEISNRGLITELLGLNLEKLDIDKMTFTTYRSAVPRSIVVPESYLGEIIRIYSDKTHAGYAWLIRENTNTEFLRSHFGITIERPEHGPALMVNSTNEVINKDYSLINIEADESQFSRMTVTNQDLVYAVHSPFWPVEATEWITRIRSHGFPSNSVIKRVVGYGCDFVQVSHEFSESREDWRFSFSRAELFIADSWSVSQRIIYGTLWVICKKIDGTYLCTYYFKTLMFWACEKRSVDFWRKDVLANSVCELLTEMISWLESKVCRNYFIRDNNMLDRFINIDLSRDIEALREISKDEHLISQVLTTFKLSEMTTSVHSDHYDLPAWLKRSFLIYTRINHYFDNYTDLFSTHMPSDLRDAIRIEFVDIFKGLQSFQLATNCSATSAKATYLSKAENHLTLVTEMCESSERDRIDNCSDAFNQLIMEYFMYCGTDQQGAICNDNNEPRRVYIESNDSQKPSTVGNDTACEASTVCNDFNETYEPSSADNDTSEFSEDNVRSFKEKKECKRLLYSRSMVEIENEMALITSNETNKKSSCYGRSLNIELHNVTHLSESCADTEIVRYKEWPGWSPTVNISWFTAKAYLANFYYTTQRDVSLALQICDDINDVYTQSRMNRWFAELALPVIVSTEWSGIYDKEIQELLGLHSLCWYLYQHLLDKSCSRTVYLGVCPIHFAIYLKVRIERAHVLGDFTTFNNFIEHEKICAGDPRVHSGVQLLLCAVENAEASAI